MMTPEQMAELANFALGLSKMAESVKRNVGVTLTAGENAALVHMIRVLSRPTAQKPEML